MMLFQYSVLLTYLPIKVTKYFSLFMQVLEKDSAEIK